jgi:hypothetical protein
MRCGADPCCGRGRRGEGYCSKPMQSIICQVLDTGTGLAWPPDGLSVWGGANPERLRVVVSPGGEMASACFVCTRGRSIGMIPASGPYSEEPTRNSGPEDVIAAHSLRSTAQYSPPVTAGWGSGLISQCSDRHSSPGVPTHVVDSYGAQRGSSQNLKHPPGRMQLNLGVRITRRSTI